MARYLRHLVLITALLAGVVGSLNLFVDPFAIWHNRCADGFNCRKTQAGDKIYLTKAYQWRHLEPEVVILGNSRPELGLNPDSATFSGAEVYNLSLRGAGLVTQARYLRNLLAEKSPQRLILNLDFLDFLQSPESKVSWPPGEPKSSHLSLSLTGQPRPHATFDWLRDRLQTLFSLDTTLASLTTLVTQQSEHNYTTLRGFNTAEGFLPIVRHEGVPALFEQKIEAMEQRLAGKRYALHDSEGRSFSFLVLQQLLDNAEQRGISVSLLISPYHVDYLAVLKKHQQFELYLSWKQALVDSLQQKGFFSEGTLSDFSGFNRYTTEAVPSRKGIMMRWYWEPSHYRSELGEEMLAALEGGEFSLTPANVTQRLEAERRTMAQSLAVLNRVDDESLRK